ncbi:dethiobiotin synthase [Thermodesulfovibrio sp.]|uniref:dethiobiotin synthase n=1 Tax=Thermodesulfovibrio sp. TaxID=2067987 RepID=UPI0030B5CA89
MKGGYFITGTDTGVGKTIVTAAILRSFIKKGLKVGAMKAIETGCLNKDGILLPSDGMFLRDMAEMSDSIDLITPLRFENPLSPFVAAKLENLEVEIDRVFKAFDALRKKYDFIVVEGVGGLMVPLRKEEKKKATFYFVRDLIKELGLSAIIITKPTLGTLNHTILTIEALKSKKIPIKGYIINFSEPAKNDIAEKTNPEALRELLDISFLGIMPYLSDLNKDTIGETAIKNLDIESLISG